MEHPIKRAKTRANAGSNAGSKNSKHTRLGMSDLPEGLVRAIAAMHPGAAARLGSLNKKSRAAVANISKNQRRRAARVGRAWRTWPSHRQNNKCLVQTMREFGAIISQPDANSKCAVAKELGWDADILAPGWPCNAAKDVCRRPGMDIEAVIHSSRSELTVIVNLKHQFHWSYTEIEMTPVTAPPEYPGSEPRALQIYKALRDAWHIMFNPDGRLAPRPSPYDMRLTRRDLELTPKETALLKRIGAAPSRFPLKRQRSNNNTKAKHAASALTIGKGAPFPVLWGPGRANKTSVRNRAMHAARHPAVSNFRS